MEFGELKNVDLRQAWPHEAHNFTPWLANNLGGLSYAIGIPLEADGTEVAVGQFSADILARDLTDDSRVLIENQLEATDHTHLGQILTYLAGLEAQTIIWVAQDFQEPHLSAVRWLNEHTVDPFAFFAVRVRVVQIADSPLAPLFEVLERPSGWDRQVRALTQETSDRRSPLGQFREDFWRSYVERHPNDKALRDGYAASSVWYPAASNQITIVQYLEQKKVGIFLRNPSRSNSDQYKQQVQAYRTALVAAGLDVHEDGGSSKRFDSNDRSNWPEMVDWLHNQMVKYRRIIEETAAAQTAAANGDE